MGDGHSNSKPVAMIRILIKFRQSWLCYLWRELLSHSPPNMARKPTDVAGSGMPAELVEFGTPMGLGVVATNPIPVKNFPKNSLSAVPTVSLISTLLKVISLLNNNNRNILKSLKTFAFRQFYCF